jgi:hypothetical protein
VEAAESAFYKPFADLPEFERRVRQKVLDAVFERTELTRAEIGVLTVDWPNAYRSDPVSLVADGSDRLEVAEGLVATAPRQAADIFSDLADELQGLGFRRRASNLRLKAGQALIAADDPGGAVEMLRRVLRHDVWWLQVEDAEIVLRDLDPSWPPELASELRVWRACCGTLRDPTGAASRLEQALGQQHAPPGLPRPDARSGLTIKGCATPYLIQHPRCERPRSTPGRRNQINGCPTRSRFASWKAATSGSDSRCST